MACAEENQLQATAWVVLSVWAFKNYSFTSFPLAGMQLAQAEENPQRFYSMSPPIRKERQKHPLCSCRNIGLHRKIPNHRGCYGFNIREVVLQEERFEI